MLKSRTINDDIFGRITLIKVDIDNYSESISSPHLQEIVRFGVNPSLFVLCRKGASVVSKV
jgi:hypothetical protein